MQYANRHKMPDDIKTFKRDLGTVQSKSEKMKSLKFGLNET